MLIPLCSLHHNILRSLFSLRKPAVTALTSKYGISSALASAYEIKRCVYIVFCKLSEPAFWHAFNKRILIVWKSFVENSVTSVNVFSGFYTVYLVSCIFLCRPSFCIFFLLFCFAHCSYVLPFGVVKRLID